MLILLVEGLLQEGRSDLLFGLLSSVSATFDPSKQKNYAEIIDEFDFEKVESVILSHVLQRVVYPD